MANWRRACPNYDWVLPFVRLFPNSRRAGLLNCIISLSRTLSFVIGRGNQRRFWVGIRLPRSPSCLGPPRARTALIHLAQIKRTRLLPSSRLNTLNRALTRRLATYSMLTHSRALHSRCIKPKERQSCKIPRLHFPTRSTAHKDLLLLRIQHLCPCSTNRT
jgi:hypothetical protein